VTVTVTNTGERAGQEVIQLYVGEERHGPDTPVKLLRAFSKIPLEAGASQKVRLSVAVGDLGRYNTDTRSFAVAPGNYRGMLGNSSVSEKLQHGSFTVK